MHCACHPIYIYIYIRMGNMRCTCHPPCLRDTWISFFFRTQQIDPTSTYPETQGPYSISPYQLQLEGTDHALPWPQMRPTAAVPTRIICDKYITGPPGPVLIARSITPHGRGCTHTHIYTNTSIKSLPCNTVCTAVLGQLSAIRFLYRPAIVVFDTVCVLSSH